MEKYPFSIPFFSRILIILHLCIALVCMLWILGYPFMGSHFKIQSEMLLLDSVISSEPDFFSYQPAKIQEMILSRYQNLQNELNFSFFEKLERALHFFREIPALEIMWIVFSIIIPILLLLRKPSALILIWLLPTVTAGYCINNVKYGLDPLFYSDIHLFPKESTLLSKNQTSYQEVKSAWENFLIKNYSKDGSLRQGEFYFNLERVKQERPRLSTLFWEKKSPLVLAIYFLWNLGIAFIVVRFSGESRPQSLQNNQAVQEN